MTAIKSPYGSCISIDRSEILSELAGRDATGFRMDSKSNKITSGSNQVADQLLNLYKLLLVFGMRITTDGLLPQTSISSLKCITSWRHK